MNTTELAERCEPVKRYIEAHWSGSMADPAHLRKGVLPLPYPFITPSDDGPFNGVQFYWDTFFADRGLLLGGRTADAQNSVEDLFWLIDRLGFVPNYSTADGAYRSQPPLLAWMVQDLFAATGDRAFLGRGYAAVAKEHAFWMRERSTPTGLNRYYHSAPEAYLGEFGHAMQRRLKLSLPEEDNRLFALHKLAEAESGWDFNPRFDDRCDEFLPVDLNSILYSMETLLADWAALLAPQEEAGWRRAAADRALRMNKWMADPATGLFYDYDFVNSRRSPVYSAASFMPLTVGLASPGQARAAAVLGLPMLECSHGAATCAVHPAGPVAYQWDRPNGWAPLQHFICTGLARYGYAEEVSRLERKYLLLVCEMFDRTGRLWEKYNVVNGSLQVADEYKMPVLLGWSAGVFLEFLARQTGAALPWQRS